MRGKPITNYCNVLGLVNTEQNVKDVLIPGCQIYVMYLSLSYVPFDLPRPNKEEH
jgi:hypothetical protein